MSAEVFWWSGFFIALGGGAVAVWALFIRGQPRGRLRCPGCWYDMAGAVADDAGAHTCPECGRRIVKARHLRRTRRLWRLAALGLLLVIAGAGLWATPMLRAQEWQRHAPSTLLVLLADGDSVDPIDETWRELFIRARYSQLRERHRTVLSERLAKRVPADEPTAARLSLHSLYLINQLRPGRSQALVARMSMLITAREKRGEPSPPQRVGYDMLHANAIEILGRVGSEADAETLSALLRTPWNPNRDRAAIALGRIGGDEAIDALTKVVAHGSEQAALTAAVALALIDKPAREHADPAIAVRFTRTAGAEERAVLAACLSVLRGEEAHISIPLMRLFMGERIGREYVSMLDEDALPALSLIMSYLDGEDPARVRRALRAIAVLGPAAAEALPKFDEMAAKPGANAWHQVVIWHLRRPD